MNKHPNFPHKSEHLSVEDSVKIKCRYCEIADICHRREQKEQYERRGWLTRCTMTPNRPGKKRKSRSRAKK